MSQAKLAHFLSLFLSLIWTATTTHSVFVTLTIFCQIRYNPYFYIEFAKKVVTFLSLTSYRLQWHDVDSLSDIIH